VFSVPVSVVYTIYYIIMDAKSKFNSELKKNREKLAKNASYITDEQYNNIIGQILELKRGVKKKEPRDFKLLKR